MKRVVLWAPMEGLPTWWLWLIILRLLWLSAELTRDTWPLVAQLLLGAVTFLVTFGLATAFTGWLRARLDDSGDPAGGRSTGPLGEG
jgi:hypothetical protein